MKNYFTIIFLVLCIQSCILDRDSLVYKGEINLIENKNDSIELNLNDKYQFEYYNLDYGIEYNQLRIKKFEAYKDWQKEIAKEGVSLKSEKRKIYFNFEEQIEQIRKNDIAYIWNKEKGFNPKLKKVSEINQEEFINTISNLNQLKNQLIGIITDKQACFDPRDAILIKKAKTNEVLAIMEMCFECKEVRIKEGQGVNLRTSSLNLSQLKLNALEIYIVSKMK